VKLSTCPLERRSSYCPPAHPAWNIDALLASPFFASLSPALARLPRDHFPTHDDLNEVSRARGIVNRGGAPIRFVAPPAPSNTFEDQYEVRIHGEGAVATRPDNWHDLFNALVWLSFPRTKGVLNAHHVRELEARPDQARTTGRRGTARDVLTLFDEGGVIVASADRSLAELLVGFRWKALFWDRRADVIARMRFRVFGHAIHEKALAPFKGVTAKALILPVDEALFALPIEREIATLDALAAAHFADPASLAATTSLAPLPVLGIPRWTPENADPAYYDDADHFRTGRRRDRARPE